MVDEQQQRQSHACYNLSSGNGDCSVDVENDEMTICDHTTENQRRKRRIEDEEVQQHQSQQDEIGYSKQPFGEAFITPFSISSMGKMDFNKNEMQQPQQRHEHLHCNNNISTNAEAYNFIPSPPSSWHERKGKRDTIEEKGPILSNTVLSTNGREKKSDFLIENPAMPTNHLFQSTFFPYSLPSIHSRRLPTPPPLPPIYSDLRKLSMPPIKKPSQPIPQRGGRGRIAVACDPCRAFKRKCSGEQPCELCKRRGRSHECKYEPGPCSLPRTQQPLMEAGPSTPKNQKAIHHRRKTSSSSTTKETQQEESETSESDFEFEDAQQTLDNKSEQISNSSMVQWNNTFQAQLQPFAPPPLPPIENNYENRYRSRSFSHPYAFSRNVLPLPRLTVVEPVQTRHRRSYSLHTPATRGESSESGRRE